jgi:hypothetical protein
MRPQFQSGSGVTSNNNKLEIDIKAQNSASALINHLFPASLLNNDYPINAVSTRIQASAITGSIIPGHSLVLPAGLKP